jgi:branched-chain amino acid transport system ATP-binding protein
MIVQDLLAVCRRLAGEGRTILIVEQNVQAALLLARRCYILNSCYILNNGLVVYEGTPAELRHDPDFMHGHLGVWPQVRRFVLWYIGSAAKGGSGLCAYKPEFSC